MLLLCSSAKLDAASKNFNIAIIRVETKNNLTVGKLLVNGKEIGQSYENTAKLIPSGKYNGVLRYSSSKNFVQGPGGKLGKTGDFLIEIADVPSRKHILFHAGNKPEHADGCVMLGPATIPDDGSQPVAPATLRKLRLLFYDGKDKPTSTPDKKINIVIQDP